MSTENTPSKSTIKPGEDIILSTRFGGCSRGKCWGKFFPGKTRATGDFEWVEKKNGSLVLTGVGYYVVGSNDGFSRKAQTEFQLTEEKEKTASEKIQMHKDKIADSESKDPEGEVKLLSPVDNLPATWVKRSVLIEERKRLIAELESELESSKVIG